VMAWLVLAGAVAAGAGMAAWRSSRRQNRHRRIQLYVHAVAVTLGAWGRDHDDPQRLDTQTHGRCRVAIDQAGDALATGRPGRLRAAENALREAQAGAREARARDDARTPTAIEHLLAAPALARLTADRLARRGDSKIDLDVLHELVEDAGQSERVLEQLVWRLHHQSTCDLTVDQLLELDDENVRRALEGVALSRSLWRIRPDWRWLELAQAAERRRTADAPPSEEDAT